MLEIFMSCNKPLKLCGNNFISHVTTALRASRIMRLPYIHRPTCNVYSAQSELICHHEDRYHIKHVVCVKFNATSTDSLTRVVQLVIHRCTRTAVWKWFKIWSVSSPTSLLSKHCFGSATDGRRRKGHSVDDNDLTRSGISTAVQTSRVLSRFVSLAWTFSSSICVRTEVVVTGQALQRPDLSRTDIGTGQLTLQRRNNSGKNAVWVCRKDILNVHQSRYRLSTGVNHEKSGNVFVLFYDLLWARMFHRTVWSVKTYNRPTSLSVRSTIITQLFSIIVLWSWTHCWPFSWRFSTFALRLSFSQSLSLHSHLSRHQADLPECYHRLFWESLVA